MYHTVRGQDTIKLYVIFNALEVSLELDELIRSPIDYVARLDKTYWIRSLRETPWRQGWALGGERRGHSSSLLCHLAMSVSSRAFNADSSGAHPYILLHAGVAQRRHQLLRLHAVIPVDQ
jgi:hypothetical protein